MDLKTKLSSNWLDLISMDEILEYRNWDWQFVQADGQLSSSYKTFDFLCLYSGNLINDLTLIKNQKMKKVFSLKNTLLGSQLFAPYKSGRISLNEKTTLAQNTESKECSDLNLGKLSDSNKVRAKKFESDCAFYIFYDETMTKVGISHDPVKRKKRHERDMNRELLTYSIVWLRSKKIALDFEYKVKKLLTSAGHKKTGGEWFQISPGVAYELSMYLLQE